MPQKRYRPLLWLRVRVKRCGKSAPRGRQRARHGKPHREQNRIGAGWAACRPRGFTLLARVGCLRRLATAVPDEWPSRAGDIPRHTEPGLQTDWHIFTWIRAFSSRVIYQSYLKPACKTPARVLSDKSPVSVANKVEPLLSFRVKPAVIRIRSVSASAPVVVNE